jgi:predicted small secreted protein
VAPQNVEVVAAPAALSRSATGSVTGPLWLRIPVGGGGRTGDDAFPGHGWSDFPATVLGWWLGRLARDTGGRESAERCDFMDGPFAFVVRRRRGDPLWTLVMPDRPDVLVDSHTFLGSVLSAARAVLKACQTNGWAGSDIDALARAIEQAASYRAA